MARKTFKKIYIEITNCCNLSCSFCPKSQRPPRFMTPEEFEHILNSIRPWTDYIYLHVKGEPLLHPQLEEILQLAQNHGFFVNMTTNGTLLTKKADILIKYPPRQINISLHSFEANTIRASFENYIADAVNFAKTFSPNYGITAFRLWNLDPASMSLPQQEKNRFILDTLRREFSFTGSLDYRCYAATDAKLAPKTFLSFDHEFQWPDLAAKDYGPDGTCQGIRSHLAILCDGTVIPCCLDAEGILSLGNIHHTSLEEILRSPRATAIRSSFQEKKITEPLCRRCGYRTRF